MKNHKPNHQIYQIYITPHIVEYMKSVLHHGLPLKCQKKEIRIDFRVVSARQRLRSPLSLWFSSFIVIFFVCCSLRFCWFKLKALILVWFPFLSLFGSRFLLFLRGEFFYWLEVSLFLCFSASSFANKVK